MKKHLTAYVEKAEKDGTLSVAIATDSSVDRDNEAIDSNGWDFNNFIKNPVLLWAHNYGEPPIGKVIDIQKDGDRILFRPQFAIESNPKAAMVYDLFQKGYLNAFSVGFIPKEWKDGVNDQGKAVRTFTKTELLEISAVPVPANANAVVLARSYAQEKGFDFDDLGIKALDDEDKNKSACHFTDAEREAIASMVDEKIASATSEIKSAIMEEVTKTISQLTAQKGTEDTKVDEPQGESEVNGEDLAKRILQAINKGTSEALRALKSQK